MTGQRLPFWHFFYEIEKALSYERWIDKYKLLLHAVMSGHIAYDDEWLHFRQFIKALCLQDHRDKERFEALLAAAIEKEKLFLETYLKKQEPSAPDVPPATEKKETESGENRTGSTPPERRAQAARNEAQEETETIEEPKEGQAQKIRYYHPPYTKYEGTDVSAIPAKADGFLQTDEYFPVTRRQMIKGWQYLRHKEKGKGIEGIDIAGTARQIARDGLFLEPTYLPSLQNRPDTLIIFADCRGSMTPFHELTARLVQTARGEGGHPKAPVFYFKNYPLGYVYRHPSLDQPVKLKEALLTANRNFTLAVVISDAGAARGNSDKERRKMRYKDTEDFLDALKVSCAHTVWLNPMPVHRWRHTAAELIRRNVLLMAPLLEKDTYDFQDTVRTILKQNLKSLQP